MPLWVLAFLIGAGVLFTLKLLFVISVSWSLRITKGALYVPSPWSGVEAFLDAVPMARKSLLVDLGCGDGRVLRAAHKRYGVRGIGFEVNPLAYLIARIRCARCKGVRILLKDFWHERIGEADVVFCYLFPDVMRPLSEKLRFELRPGTRVICANFSLADWPPVDVVRPGNRGGADPIFIYRVPESHPQAKPPI